MREVVLDLAAVAWSLPAERLGELAGSHLEEPGDLEVELASCVPGRFRPTPMGRRRLDAGNERSHRCSDPVTRLEPRHGPTFGSAGQRPMFAR